MIEELPDREDLLTEICLFDDRVWPHEAEQGVLVDRLAGVLEENDEDVERAGGDGQRLPITRDHPSRGVDGIRAEHVFAAVGHLLLFRTFEGSSTRI
ncbi:MAG TPA: hypothetical protein VNJ54_02285 [Plantibacter sp.]|nr:hypothetical protein [Plantibacter sp.]